MIVLAWIGQILLFFIFWRLFHWLFDKLPQLSMTSMVMQIVINVVVAIVLLLIVSNVHSAWWLMILIGAVVGVFTGEMVANGRQNGI